MSGDDHLGATEGGPVYDHLGIAFNEDEVEASYFAASGRLETATERLWRDRTMPHWDERIRGEREIERMGTMASGTPDMSKRLTDSPYIKVTPQELKERLAEDTVKAKEVHARPINCSHGNHVPLMKMFSLDMPHVCKNCRSYYLPR